jgi:hypothetical protein
MGPVILPCGSGSLEFGLVAGTTQHGKKRIFRKVRIALRELAEQEVGTARRRDGTRVNAVGAKAERGGKIRICGLRRHP